MENILNDKMSDEEFNEMWEFFIQHIKFSVDENGKLCIGLSQIPKKKQIYQNWLSFVKLMRQENQ